MCSVLENESDIPTQKERNSIGRLCMKCKTETAVLITRVNDAFCRDCFMVYVTHKFRATIGKSKLIRDGEKVLVAYSGGPSSSCLLHLIMEGLSQRAHKKLRFKPGLVFVDESEVLEHTAEEHTGVREKIHQLMTDTGYPCHFTSLNKALDLEKESSGQSEVFTDKLEDVRVPPIRNGDTNPVSGELPDRPVTMDTEKQLIAMLSTVKSLSAKEETIKSLRNMMLIHIAKTHGYSKVMTGHCGTRLAVNLLSDISQGRGAHVAIDTAFSDKRHKDVMIVRPIRDFSSKEVAMYNSLNGVETVFVPTITTKTPEGSSIEHLTEAFVTGLQSDYPSTVSNIMRTGEKLSSEKKENGENSSCVICEAPLDTNVGPSSALSAVEFSQKISQKGRQLVPECKENSECCGEGDGSCHTKSNSLNKEDVLSALCYGCRLMIKDMNDVNKLPVHVLKEISWRTRRSKMKEDIQEFLLDPSAS